MDKPWKASFWLFFRTLGLIGILPMILFIYMLTFYLPQLPTLIRTRLPDGNLKMHNSVLSTTIAQPSIFTDKDVAVILNTEGNEEILTKYPVGILFLKDKLVVKDETGAINSRSYEKIPNFDFNKGLLADLIVKNKTKLWFIGLLLIVIIYVLSILQLSLNLIITLGLLGLVAWLVGNYLLKREFLLVNSLKLALYSSILPILLSGMLFMLRTELTALLPPALSLFTISLWVWHLPKKQVSS
jgi:hypothetical protein